MVHRTEGNHPILSCWTLPPMVGVTSNLVSGPLPSDQPNLNDSSRWLDEHWGQCLCRVRVFGKHQHPRFSNEHWAQRLLFVHIFEKHQRPRFSHRHWVLYLRWVRFFGMHRHSRFSDQHWGQCLCRVQIFEKHQHPCFSDEHWEGRFQRVRFLKILKSLLKDLYQIFWEEYFQRLA